LTSDNPRTEKPEAILAEMHAGIEDLPQNKVHVISNRHEAIKKACQLAVSGDFILVAGKGHETYHEENGVKTHFDDLEELEKNLK
jgi:UDP-N-acetylmuramoyl-L-alanyl-D-glutamate--2,6-diaminopimelate ligase